MLARCSIPLGALLRSKPMIKLTNQPLLSVRTGQYHFIQESFPDLFKFIFMSRIFFIIIVSVEYLIAVTS